LKEFERNDVECLMLIEYRNMRTMKKGKQGHGITGVSKSTR
jgi:hypothetical protein